MIYLYIDIYLLGYLLMYRWIRYDYRKAASWKVRTKIKWMAALVIWPFLLIIRGFIELLDLCDFDRPAKW